MKKSNNKSKVVSAVAMLMVSVLTLSSATYAWFTMSKQVEVDGIELTATAPDNVLIATNDNTGDGYDNIGDYANKKSAVVGTADIYKGGTTTNLAATDKLYPASSTNGVDVFQTPNINDDGSDKGATGSIYADADTTAKEIYYVDVPLYILTTGTADVKVEIDEAQSKIEANTSGEIYKAARFAVLDGTAANNIGGTYEASADRFTNAEQAVETIDGSGKATYESANSAKLLGTDQTITATQFTLVGTAATTPAATVDSKYRPTKVTVRVWIEGQNANCKTANADQKFKVKLVFKAV